MCVFFCCWCCFLPYQLLTVLSRTGTPDLLLGALPLLLHGGGQGERVRGQAQDAVPSSTTELAHFSPMFTSTLQLLNSLQYCFCSIQAVTPAKLLYRFKCRCIHIFNTFVLKETTCSYNVSDHVTDIIFKSLDTKMLAFHSHNMDQPEEEQTLTTIGWCPHICTLLFISIRGIWLHAGPMRSSCELALACRHQANVFPLFDPLWYQSTGCVFNIYVLSCTVNSSLFCLWWVKCSSLCNLALPRTRGLP